VAASANATNNRAVEEQITGVNGFGLSIIVNAEFDIWFDAPAPTISIQHRRWSLTDFWHIR
jgi:hypothetical protein